MKGKDEEQRIEEIKIREKEKIEEINGIYKLFFNTIILNRSKYKTNNEKLLKEIDELNKKIKTSIFHIGDNTLVLSEEDKKDQLEKDKKEYINYIKYITDLNNIIKTGLQANPRKIKRFLDVFEIYLKILLYRIIKEGNEENITETIFKQSGLLSKMLIIKLEWDEVYREFIKDKLHLLFIEDIAKKVKEGNIEFSFKIDKYIRKSKQYKIGNLFGMLAIGEQFKNEEFDGYNSLIPIYNIYYLYIFQGTKENTGSIEENENQEYLGNINLLKYLYEYDEKKVDFYVNQISIGNDKIKNILEGFKKYFIEEEKIERTNINILNNNKTTNEK
ncbi:MAG: hypothetical protein Q9M97_00025 [Candidatus Gracilibacteria bacterium]|nr:hypothetical protein [Candidatus Gracilibacteria bacterium]